MIMAICLGYLAISPPAIILQSAAYEVKPRSGHHGPAPIPNKNQPPQEQIQATEQKATNRKRGIILS